MKNVYMYIMYFKAFRLYLYIFIAFGMLQYSNFFLTFYFNIILKHRKQVFLFYTFFYFIIVMQIWNG